MPPSFQEDMINKIPGARAAHEAGLYLPQSGGGVGGAGREDDQGFAFKAKRALGCCKFPIFSLYFPGKPTKITSYTLIFNTLEVPINMGKNETFLCALTQWLRQPEVPLAFGWQSAFSATNNDSPAWRR
jgi:hypothetical protein